MGGNLRWSGRRRRRPYLPLAAAAAAISVLFCGCCCRYDGWATTAFLIPYQRDVTRLWPRRDSSVPVLLLLSGSISDRRGGITSRLWMVGDGHEDDPSHDPKAADETSEDSSIPRRFTAPVVDDPGLPLADVLVAQVMAPSLQIAWLSWQHAPQPTWLQLRPLWWEASVLYPKQGSFVAPTLIHGAALALCWIVGALASKAYERKRISPVPKTVLRPSSRKSGIPMSNVEWDYSAVYAAIFQGGAFATGLWILATQADLFLEFGRWVPWGESDVTDFRLLLAAVELLHDVFFEAATLTAWRLVLAYQTERMSKE